MSAIERLKRWRDVGDGDDRYCPASKRFGDDVIELLTQVERAEGERDVLEANARVQAKLLADTGRERDALAAQVEIARRALERISESRRSDFKTLHPDGCAEEARSVLARWKQSTSTEQRS